MKILTNHIGYERSGAKRAVLQGKRGDRPLSFRVVDAESGKKAWGGQGRRL